MFSVASIMGILSGIVDVVLKFIKGMGPSPLVVEAEKAGAANQALQTVEAANAEITKAAEASNDVAARISTDDGLRKYESTDPYNRDNAGG